ncbi:MAG: BMP family ABC transporter substrate-binding protein [Oscillospiraceae bacterium]|nr:BMP family ABC transporter substrate-binding protein [Oscillospiraceae bacterium]
MKKIIITVAVIIVVLVAGIYVINIYEADSEVTKEATKVGLILNGYKDDKSWSQSHYESLTETARELNLNIICKEYVTTDNAAYEIQNLVDEGCEVIIANSDLFKSNVIKAAELYPEVYFLHASGTEYSKNLCSYFGRMYQARYLAGLAAGLQTKTGSIGYVAAMPICEVNRGINAFALGVRSVNPDAQIYVRWTDSWTGDLPAQNAAEQLLIEHDIDVITVHTDTIAPLLVAEEKGISAIGYNVDNRGEYPNAYLTAAVWDWKPFYTAKILSCLQGKFVGDNYWEGIDTGMVSLAPLSDKVGDEVSEIVEEAKQRLLTGAYDVFYGPIYDNNGTLRVAEGECMTDSAMLNEFDWYVEGVVIES